MKEYILIRWHCSGSIYVVFIYQKFPDNVGKHTNCDSENLYLVERKNY